MNEPDPDFGAHAAWRWEPPNRFSAVRNPALPALDSLQFIERQKEQLLRNTAAFLDGRPANHALLWGARGCGKSSLVKSVFGHFRDQGLKLIEVEASQLRLLPDLVDPLGERAERFVIYADDLSFESDDPAFRAVKAVLDGSISGPPENVLVYATSNRRHLMPEYMSENRDTRMVDNEIHPSEAVEEKISLSDRFGLWLPFHGFSQDEYLELAEAAIKSYGIDTEPNDEWREQALQWALQRGSRSGRVAEQFARDFASRVGG